jgi:hypothetical protein
LTYLLAVCIIRPGLVHRSSILRDELLKAIARVAWERWQIISHINGEYVARFVTNLFYFTILVPFAIGVKLFTDPLDLRRTAASHWKEHKPVGATIDDARSQF